MPDEPQNPQTDEDRFIEDARILAGDSEAAVNELAENEADFLDADSRAEDLDDQEERDRDVQVQNDLIQSDALSADELIPENPDAMTQPDTWSAPEEIGHTAEERREGESLDLREHQTELEEVSQET